MQQGLSQRAPVWCKGAQKALQKMDSEQACRIVRPSGCTRYRTMVLMAPRACVPEEAVFVRKQ